MIIVGINGGLGNQMFQYALYLKLNSIGREVYLDDEILVNKLNDSKALKIFDVFDLDYQLCDRKTRESMADVGMDIFSRVRRKLFGKRDDDKTCFREVNLDDNYYPDLFEYDNKYISGCWQTEKYFADIKNEIIQHYSFNINDNDAVVKDLVGQITTSNSVSLHIRRGDYLNNSLYEGVCTDEYYNNAITYIKQNVDNPIFYIFSDDVEYAKNRYHGDDFVIIDEFHEKRSHYDMYLMTQCKYNIVANSSFSWWGAWLNQNKDKIVVCPTKWSNQFEFRYTPCDSWVKI